MVSVGRNCVGCERGKFLELPLEDGLGCVICPGGYYQQFVTGDTQIYPNDQGQQPVTVLYCQACLSGRFLRDDGSDKAQHMFARDCISCENGKFSRPGSRFCLTCPAGKNTVVSGTTTTCVECTVGKFQKDPGQTECDNCLAGYYQPSVGNPYCLPCIPGMYQKIAGKNECDDCEVGRFTGMIGQAFSCDDCEVGKEMRNVGGTRCFPCNAGQFQSTGDGTNCRNCPKGKHRNNGIECNACPIGKYSSEGGWEECKECLGRSQWSYLCICPVFRIDFFSNSLFFY